MKLVMTQGNLKSVLGDRRGSPSILTGRIIRRLREISGKSQSDLARSATANLSYISSIESGKNNISIRKVLLLCNALRIPPAIMVTIQTRMERSMLLDVQ